MLVNLAYISQMIDAIAQRGVMPAEIHLSADTHKHFVATMMVAGPCEAPKRKTRWQRLADWILRVEVKPESWRFRNLPLVVNTSIPDGGILIRPLHLMQDPNWIQTSLDEQKKWIDEQTAQQVTPFRFPPQGPATTEAEVKSSEAFKENLSSVSKILIDATTNCDDARAVVVIKMGHDDDITVTSSCDRFALFGLLQATISKVAQGS